MDFVFDNFLPIAFAAIVLFVAYKAYLRHRELSAEEDRREAYRQRIEEDPANTAAYEALGESLYQAGRLAEAKVTFELAARTLTERDNNGHINQRLRAIKEAIVEQNLPWQTRLFGVGRQRPEREAYFCQQCGAANSPLRPTCRNCGTTLPYDRLRDAFRDPEVRNSALEFGAVIAVISILFSLVDFLPIEAKGAIFIAAVAVLSWRLLKKIGGDYPF